MAEFYKALFEYATEQKDELSVKEGEILRITNKENADWWIAERLNHSKSFGLVPSNFLERVQLVVVTKDYEAQDGDELDLHKDEKLILLGRDKDWTKGELNGKTGIFPSSHVEEYSAEKKPGFKLAAYGVKQGGIGSILAGGIQKKSSSRESIEEEPKPPPRLSPRSSSESKKEVKAMVLHDYSAENEDEITLMRGEYITILEQQESSGWWKGANERGSSGAFPANFVQIVDQAPQRPTRTRPPTVKSEESAGTTPPPVPVGTRPSSLLTQRATSPPTRPLTSPPPRPLTTPPRPLSVSTTHRRTPSIPVTSPDLPPLSPVHTTRPVIPRPTSSIDAAMNNMAKPPKINLTPKLPPASQTGIAPVASTSTSLSGPIAPPRSRPTSVQEAHPPVPKRSMPQLPKDEIEKLIEKELDKLRQEFEVRLEQERKRLEELIYSEFQ